MDEKHYMLHRLVPIYKSSAPIQNNILKFIAIGLPAINPQFSESYPDVISMTKKSFDFVKTNVVFMNECSFIF
jgi:hypothetical protein